MNDTKTYIGETLNQISANRTLIAKKFTINEVLKPEVVHGLQTVDQVFEHYRPAFEFRFEDAAGFTHLEELKFKAVDDFSWSNINRQSLFLTREMAKKKMYLKLAGLLKTNQSLIKVFADANKRNALGAMVEAMIEDLKK